MVGNDSRSGVSPLIASVLLIAFTMAVAAILVAWVTTFTQEQTDTLENESAKQIDCSFAQLDIFDAQTSGSDVLVSVTNTGTVNTTVVVEVFRNGQLVTSGEITGLESGRTESIELSDSTNGDEETVRVSSPECPQVSVEEDI